MKENQHVQPIIADDFKSVTFKTKGREDLILYMEKIHPDLRARAACVGFAQVRVVDAAAVPMTRKDGSIIPEETRLDMKHEGMRELIEHLHSGSNEWSRVGKGGSGKSLTIEAIARVKGIDYAKAEAFVEDYAKRNYEGDRAECLAFLREGKRVMEAMAAIRAERAPAPKVDADAALNEIAAQ